MKVIFLDIDGVLNTIQGNCYHMIHGQHSGARWKEKFDREERPHDFKHFMSLDWCPVAISNLTWILRSDPDIKIVVSSVWRLSWTEENQRWLFVHFPEIFDRVIGRTKRLFDDKGQTVRRGLEIQEWLDRERAKGTDITGFAIIDDDADMEHLIHHLVQTDGYHGLTYKDIDRTLNLLGVPREGFTKAFFACKGMRHDN